MEILKSGSFVPLDNRDKIEQLIFTARTLANEVSRNEGYQTNGQSSQQIGLELWNGAEYMTRAHEEVTIRNIFLSKFLERLREIEREPAQRPQIDTRSEAVSLDIHSGSIPTVLADIQVEVEQENSAAQQDEFLGVLGPQDTAEVRPSYANECVPEFEDEIAGMIADEKDSDLCSATGSENAITRAEESSKIPDETPCLPEQSIKSVVLSEQEPYNFDSCTITAVLQLLPEVNGMRDLVLSVRSHDFAPQIILSNIAVEGMHTGLSAQAVDALHQYRTALPELAAEKLKKKKPAKTKRSPKPTETKATGSVETGTSDSGSSSGQALPEQTKEQQNLFTS